MNSGENTIEMSYRTFGGIDDSLEDVSLTTEMNQQLIGLPVTHFKEDSVSVKIATLRENIIGNFDTFSSPFGEKPIVYCDWTASGRALKNVETFIQENILKLYGNTHTTTSITGHQSTCFRHESRQIIAEATNAKITGKAAQDVVLFVGNGTTAAVHKLISFLNLSLPLPENYDENVYRPVVFTSSYEHHSNLLPWRESSADVVTISYNPITGVDLEDLKRNLQLYSQRKLKIGAFSAASNVTGILTDVTSVSIMIHKAGGLVFFDYATAAPYVKMDMNLVVFGPDSDYAYIDAMYFSGHKFLGGCGSPGVLIVKKKLLPAHDFQPTQPGGGTVFYVTDDYHRYLSNREEREEGGTPDIIGDIKLGLAVHIKSLIGAVWIENEELRISKLVENRLKAIENLVLLGSVNEGVDFSVGRKLPIFSFLIRCQRRFLHFNFVCALLNDLFGIQSRGGCQCAGPYSQMLLGLTDEANANIELALLEKHEVFRPGYSRLSFPYWLDNESIEYILNAIAFVAEYGWKFLPIYRYNHKTGDWAHTTRLTRFPERIWLSNLTLTNSNKSDSAAINLEPKSLHQLFSNAMASALTELKVMEGSLRKRKGGALSMVMDANTGTADLDSLRWFVLPEEASILVENFNDDILGPINPMKNFILNSIIDRPIDADMMNVHATLDGKASLYAKKRHMKLRARVGGENSIPRYLTIMDSENNLMAVVTQHKMALDSDSSAIEKKLPNISVDIAPKDGSPEENEFPTNASTCTDGSCLLPRKTSAFTPVIPESTATIVTASGKILSGPGVVYNPLHKPTIYPATVPKKVIKLVGQAIKDFNMIEEGDRLLLGLSGGKDSLCLLHVLLALQKRAPVRFEIACATVDPQTESYDPTPLIPYLQALGVTYHYLSEPIVQLAKSKLQGDSLCAFCARFKRGLLYSCCRNFNYNKLVLGQHLDDLAESFMMSALHNGQIRTMKANYSINVGDIRVIRPLVYVREKQTRDFSVGAKLPIINENCPACFEQPKERARIKKLLLQEESMVPMLYYNLKKGLQPLMHEKTYQTIKDIVVELEANNRIFRERIPLSTKVKRGNNQEKQDDLDSIHDDVATGTECLDNEDDFKDPSMFKSKRMRSDLDDF